MIDLVSRLPDGLILVVVSIAAFVARKWVPPMERSWSNDETLQEVFRGVCRVIYRLAYDPETLARMRESVMSSKTNDFRAALVNLLILPVSELVSYLDGAIGPTDLPRLGLINLETGRALSEDYGIALSEAEAAVLKEFLNSYEE